MKVVIFSFCSNCFRELLIQLIVILEAGGHAAVLLFSITSGGVGLQLRVTFFNLSYYILNNLINLWSVECQQIAKKAHHMLQELKLTSLHFLFGCWARVCPTASCFSQRPDLNIDEASSPV